jgi:hypothetical protein
MARGSIPFKHLRAAFYTEDGDQYVVFNKYLLLKIKIKIKIKIKNIHAPFVHSLVLPFSLPNLDDLSFFHFPSSALSRETKENFPY